MTEGRLTPLNADLWAYNVLACDVLQLSQNGASSPGRMNVQICSTNIEIGITHWHTLQLSRCVGVCAVIFTIRPSAAEKAYNFRLLFARLARQEVSMGCAWHTMQGMWYGQRGMPPARPCLHRDCLSLHAAPVWVCVSVSVNTVASSSQRSTCSVQCLACSKQQARWTLAEVKRLLNGEAAKCKCCL